MSYHQRFINNWKPFEITVDTTVAGITGTGKFQLPLHSGGSYRCFIDWGDNTADKIQSYNQAETLHDYNTTLGAGIYTIKIYGKFDRIYFNNAGDKAKLKTIESFGNIIWKNFEGAFYGCSAMTGNFTEAPIMEYAGISLSNIFRGCSSFNTSIDNWDVSKIENMISVFQDATMFNKSLSSWNTSNVTNMTTMFRNADSFDSTVDTWDVTKVTTMALMFGGTANFDQPLDNWDVSNITVFASMFDGAVKFNQPLSSWIINTSFPVGMAGMFFSANSFNQNLNSWDMTQVTDTRHMFLLNTAFNNGSTTNDSLNPLTWTLPNVTLIGGMFGAATKFNQDVSSFTVSGVSTFFFGTHGIFDGATLFNNGGSANINNWVLNPVGGVNCKEMFISSAFNQDISGWDMTKVTTVSSMLPAGYTQDLTLWNTINITNFVSLFKGQSGMTTDVTGWNLSSANVMGAMFINNTTFNQDIGGWNISPVTDISSMFSGASSFNKDISGWDIQNVTTAADMLNNAAAFSDSNYDLLLNNWNANTHQNGVSLGATHNAHTIAVSGAARTALQGDGWTISDLAGI